MVSIIADVLAASGAILLDHVADARPSIIPGRSVNMEFADFERHLIWPRIRAVQAQMQKNGEALERCQVLAMRLRSSREQMEAGRTPLADVLGPYADEWPLGY